MKERERERDKEREEVHVNTEVNYMDIRTYVHSRLIRHACYLYGYGRG